MRVKITVTKVSKACACVETATMALGHDQNPKSLDWTLNQETRSIFLSAMILPLFRRRGRLEHSFTTSLFMLMNSAVGYF